MGRAGSRRSVARALIGTAVVALCAVTVIPAQATHGQPDKELPITIELTSTLTDRDFVNTGDCSVPSDWIWIEEGTGTASRLGRVTYTLRQCTQALTGTFQEGMLEITAANGDTLEIEHYGTFEVNPDEGVSYAQGVASIVGGTGRFAGATGELSEMVEFHFANETNYSTTTGHIVYDASNRASR